MLTVPLWLLIGLTGVTSECKPDPIQQIRVLAPQQLVSLDPWPGADCVVAVEIPQGATHLVVTVQVAEDGVIAPAPLPPTLLDTISAVNGDSTEVTFTFRIPSRQTQPLSLSVLVGDRKPGAARRTAQVPLYLMRPPELTLSPSLSSCPGGGVCLKSEGTSTVLLSGAGLEEVRTGAKAAKFHPIPGGPPVELEIVASEPHVAIRIPQRADLPIGKYELEIATRSRFFRPSADGRPAESNSVKIGPLLVEHEKRESVEMRFSDQPSGELTVFVGETMPVRVALPGDARVRIGTYRVLEGIGDKGKEVALLDVLDGRAARIVGITATKEAFRRSSLPEVTIREVIATPADGKGAPQPQTYHAHLQVVPAPVVRSMTVHHTQIAAYDGAAVRPGERVKVTLQGETLRAFDRIQLSPANGVIHDSLRTDEQITLELTADRGAKGVLPIVLSSELVRDTLLEVPVASPQRPRPLSFVTLDRRAPGDRRWKIIPRSRLDSVIVAQAPSVLDASDLTQVGLRFDRARVDDGELFGPQYLVVTAELRGDDGHTVRSDSARIVVLPEKADGYVVAPGYSQVNELRLDELLRRATRYAGAGTALNVTIRHDEPRYGGRKGAEITLTIANRSRLRVTPRLDLLAGLTYFAEVPATDALRRTPLLNGPGADTIVRRVKNADWRVDLFDVTGGASAAVDLDYLNPKGLPSPMRLRVAFLVVSDPFREDRKRRLGGALLYPVELYKLDGGLSLSLAVGYGHLIGGRGFGIIVPGVGFALPQL